MIKFTFLDRQRQLLVEVAVKHGSVPVYTQHVHTHQIVDRLQVVVPHQ